MNFNQESIFIYPVDAFWTAFAACIGWRGADALITLIQGWIFK